jgi:hypothetical protein
MNKDLLKLIIKTASIDDDMSVKDCCDRIMDDGGCNGTQCDECLLGGNMKPIIENIKAD